MLVGMVKIYFEYEPKLLSYWPKKAQSLCHKMMARHKVIAKANSSSQGEFVLIVLALGQDRNGLQRLFSQLLDLASMHGFSRVEDHMEFMDNVDEFFNEDDSSWEE